MTADPQQADAPDNPADIAWEVRHCASRLEDLAELVGDVLPAERADTAAQRLHDAAERARGGAAWIKARPASDALRGES